MRTVLLAILLLCACSRDPAAPAAAEPGDPVAAQPIRFEDFFTRIELLDGGTGLPGLPDDTKGFRFSRKATLQLSATALQAATIRLVVLSRTTGEPRLGIARPVTAGENLLTLGQLPGDLYELQVLVRDTRVTLIAFAAE